MKASAASALKWFRYQPIRRRILITFVFLSLLTALLVSAGTSAIHFINGREQAIERLTSALSLKKMEIENWVASLDNELQIVLNDAYNNEQIPVVLKVAQSDQYFNWYNKAVQKRLAFMVGQSSKFKALCLLDINGEIVLCSTDNVSSGQCQAENFFQKGIEQTFIQLSFEAIKIQAAESASCWLETQAKERGFAIISRPVVNTHNEVVGLIAGLADSEPLSDILNNRTSLGHSGKAYIAYPDRHILSPTGEGKLALSTFSESTAFFPISPQIRADKQFHHAVYTDYQEKTVLGVITWIEDQQIFLAVEQDTVDVFQPVLLNILISLGIGLGAILVTAFAALFITRSITRPVTDLVNTASEIANGRLEKSVSVYGKDEISNLGKVFNSMTAQLRNLINNLEEIVQTRTSDLQNANRTLEKRALQMEASARVSREITTFLNHEDLLNNVTRLIAGAFHYQDVRIYLLDDSRLVLRARSNPDDSAQESIPLSQAGLQPECFQSGKAVISRKTLENGAESTEGELPEVCVPLQIGKKIVGILNLVLPAGTRLSEEELLLSQSLGDQIAVAIENTQLHKLGLELAVHQERGRLARDLHDSVVQYLYSLNLMTTGWQRLLQAGRSGDIQGYLERTGQISHQALKEMRLMVYQLQMDDLEWKGLATTLARRLDMVEERAGVKSRLVVADEFILPFNLEENLYLIANEALNNSLKYSGASEVAVDLKAQDREVRLTVWDNGVGFDPSQSDSSGGMGLQNMKARAASLNGTLTIQSSRESGTTVMVTIPLENV